MPYPYIARGASFEGMVIEELAALSAARRISPELFFWRTQVGAEVDLLVVAGRRIRLWKSSSEPRRAPMPWPG
ncbi:MAG TPA: DUF4143 domain-containing protein [Candidatus Binatia bacterium]|nr:DUF4143 domain-containing protein [Candidatus Binatia bacterium]